MKKTSIVRKVVTSALNVVPVGQTVRIRRGPLRGMKWIAGAAAGEGRGLAPVLDMAETAQIAFAKSLCNSEAICFDFGANVGLYTLLFARYCRYVYAFEPVPRNVMYLQQAILKNHLVNVTVMPVAIGEQLSLALFAAGENFAVGGLSEEGEQPVAVISCDAFVEAYGIEPDIIKVDVEGAETSVLRGAKQLLAKRHAIILLSVHSRDLRAECLALLREEGYQSFKPLNGPDIEHASELVNFSPGK